MGSGKSHGSAREYQVLARDILISRSPFPLVPISGDGIDVAIDIGGVPRYFDIGLKDKDGGKLVVGECRDTADPVKLADLDTFAYRVEMLRKDLNLDVAGFYFTRRAYQRGVVKAAKGIGIAVAVCAPDQPLEAFSLVFHGYDRKREARLREAEAHLAGSVAPTGSLGRVVRRADATVENHGEV
jgi:hypothetical protein